jgi:hypothetical protein
MNVTIDYLVITLCTNIDNVHAPSSSYGNQTFKEPKQNIDFTSSMLTYDKPEGGFPAPLTKYPFFTQDVLYDSSVLLTFDYYKLVEIFFNENSFRSLLVNRLPQTDIDSMTPEQLQIFRFNNGRKNVMTMLFALFTTAYPIKSDISESLAQLSDKWSEEKIWQLLYDITIKADTFSYLTIHSKVYTVKRAVWMNDILNHPRYRVLLEEFQRFTVRMNDTIERKKRQMNAIVGTGGDYEARKKGLEKEIKRLEDVLSGGNAKDLAQEFPSFSNYLTKFRKNNPSREAVSTNFYLQDMIDSPDLGDMFTFLQAIYNKYILDKGGNPYTDKKWKDCFNTGVTSLYQKNSNDPAFRIYVMMDLVEGKLTSDIVKQVDCQFNDVDLARELRILTMKQKDTFFWEVDRNRMFYKLVERTDEKTKQRHYELDVKPFIYWRNKINYTAGEFDQEQFLDWIFRSDYKESVKAKEMLTSMRTNFSNSGVSEFTVLDVIKRKYPEFYRLIIGWNMTSDRTDPSLLTNIRIVSRDIERELRYKLEDASKDKPTYDTDLANLIFQMTKAMATIESAKSTRQGGAPLRRRRKSNRKVMTRHSRTMKKR